MYVRQVQTAESHFCAVSFGGIGCRSILFDDLVDAYEFELHSSLDLTTTQTDLDREACVGSVK
jgi:hypothetical protein